MKLPKLSLSDQCQINYQCQNNVVYLQEGDKETTWESKWEGKELYECTIQCEVKNILYALSCFVHFSYVFVVFVSMFLLGSTKLKQCVQAEIRRAEGLLVFLMASK